MRAPSLRLQIITSVLLLVAGFVAVFSLNIVTSLERVARTEMIEKAVMQARNLALSYTKPLLHNDPEFELHPHISRMLASSSDITGIIVVDRGQVIKGHRDLQMIDARYAPPEGFEPVGRTTVMLPGERLRENGQLIEVTVPMTDQGEYIGEVHMMYSKQAFNAALEGIHGRAVRIGVIAMAAGVLLSILLASYISRPVKTLARGVRRIGEGHLDTRISVRSVREIHGLAETFNAMAASLEISRSAIRDKERMVRELEIAREIQKTLLPSVIPSFAGFELNAIYRPASQVGGDYYDFIPLDAERVLIVVADVAGKGVPGLVIMAMLRILVHDLAARGERPARMLRHLNSLLRKDISNTFFITCFCGILDTRSLAFDFASAAHMPLLHRRAAGGSIVEYRTKVKPLGPFNDEVFCRGLEETRILLEPGDLLLQYTDGLNEMRDISGEEFGFERVERILRKTALDGPEAVLRGISDALDEFRGDASQSDDLTLLALSLLPGHAACGDRREERKSEAVSVDA